MHRIDGPGHVDNKWVPEDLDTMRPPTEITAAFMNAIQEELAAVILWAGLNLDKADNAQLKKALLAKVALLDSPEFCGAPKAPTAELDDASTILANTEFVHQLVAATVLDLDLGKFALLSAPQVFAKGQRGAVAALPATAGTVALDLSLSNNWEGTLTGNIVLANPAVMPVGQSGVIRIVNAGPYTNAYGSFWKPGDGVTLPALTTVAGASDDFVYYVESATRVVVSKVGGSV